MLHKIAALALAVLAVAFLVGTAATGAATPAGPTADRGALARADEAAARIARAEDEAQQAAERAQRDAEEEAAAEGRAMNAAAADEADADAAADATGAEGDASSDAAAADDAPSVAQPASVTDAEEVSAPFASAAGVQLHAVSDAVRVTGYHQAGRSSRAVPIEPAEPTVAAPSGRRGAMVAPGTSLVLPSRGRGTAATSAVDLAVPAGEPIASPVDGVVREVEGYRLYGRSDDVAIRITPHNRRDLEVTVLHVDGARVRPGDRVVGGETVIADTARVLPLRSQLERYSGTMPHVHLDVRPPEPAEKSA